jgi:hypothetical protein
MRLKVDATELRKWPLMHGTTNCCEEDIKSMQTVGLIAKYKTNSFWYDAALERTQYVFVKPPNFSWPYGLGKGLLVDPSVLQKPDILFFDQDIGEAVDFTKIIVDGGEYCGVDIRSESKLRELISKAAQPAGKSHLTADQITEQIVCSREFYEYYRKDFCLSSEEFFRAIEQIADQRLFSYFGRDNMHTEEIEVRGIIDPKYLLGFWNGERWFQWREASTEDTRYRVKEFIDILPNLVKY